MLDKYNNDVELLLEWYERAKEVAIEAESLDTENKSLIQPLHEQRYCLDHFIRAIIYERNGDDEGYIKKAISSAIGHLQRAYADSIEWIQISVIEEYTRKLEPFTSEQINKGFPAYYEKIRPELDNITEIVNSYKIHKSVEKASSSLSAEDYNEISTITNQFLEKDVVEKLKSYLQELKDRELTLLEIKERDKKENRMKNWIIPIIVGVIVGVVVGIIVLLIGRFI